MELGKVRVSSEQVIFDCGADMSTGTNNGDLYYEFRIGRSSFGHDLYDAVAINNGLDKEGRLDMGMVAAAEQAKDYLEGRQGQPVVAVETISRDGRILRIDGLVGVLADSDKLIGTFEVDKNKKAGINLSSGPYEISFEFSNHARLERAIKCEEKTILPLSFYPFFRLGKPGYFRKSQEHTYTQDLVAGDDILPWIAQIVGENSAGYELFCGITSAIESGEAKEYLLKEPYTSMLREEQLALKSIGEILSETKIKIDVYSQVIEGLKADANLQLFAIKEGLGELALRLPLTQESHRTSVVAMINDIPGIEQRLIAVSTALTKLRQIEDKESTKATS